MHGPDETIDSDSNRKLDLLAGYYYALAAITALLLLPLALYLIGWSILFASMFREGSTPPPLAHWPGILLACLIVALQINMAVLTLTGYALTVRRQYHFTIWMILLSFAIFPIGTILGIFALHYLSKPGLTALFDSPLSREIQPSSQSAFLDYVTEFPPDVFLRQ